MSRFSLVPSPLTLIFEIIAVLAVQILVPVQCWAQGRGFGSSTGFTERQKDRDKKRWYFYDWLEAKQQAHEQDLLYRFYISQNENPKPQLEPTFYGLVETGNVESGPPAENLKFTGAGYGGSLYFNNFVSATLGIPMPNSTLGLDASRREEKMNGKNVSAVTRYAPSLRLLGRHHQDSAVFLNYRHLSRSVFGQKFQDWASEGGARIYVFPQLAIEGATQINEQYVHASPSPVARHQSFWFGGFLEVQMFKLGFRVEKDVFFEREGNGRLTEERRQAFFGFSI